MRCVDSRPEIRPSHAAARTGRRTARHSPMGFLAGSPASPLDFLCGRFARLRCAYPVQGSCSARRRRIEALVATADWRHQRASSGAMCHRRCDDAGRGATRTESGGCGPRNCNDVRRDPRLATFHVVGSVARIAAGRHRRSAGRDRCHARSSPDLQFRRGYAVDHRCVSGPPFRTSFRRIGGPAVPRAAA
jgi:hypothetical protein